jgi:adenylate cyclase
MVAGQRVERKLAAILAADVAGYSRLTGLDEEGTLAKFRTFRRELIDPAISAHGGRLVKTTGDGLLIEFHSVVDAVRCAVHLQGAIAERNALTPSDRRLQFRIGIHVGDIVVDDDDLLGDGVNIAARLEAIAEPGGIALSEDAWRQVRDKLPLAFTDRGEQSVKNIARPIRVYDLAARSLSAAAAPPAPNVGERRRRLQPSWQAAMGGLGAVLLLAAALWLAIPRLVDVHTSSTPSRFSMIVLPFVNLSGDPAQDYLADVITEELTTSLSRIPNAFVIARSTAFTYKGKAIEVRQIGKELGVRYLLEGSEQRRGDRLRVTAQLIDAETGAHLWADQIDSNRADLLAMQDEIVTRLSRAMQMQLVEVDAARVARARPDNADAEDLAMRCQALVVNALAVKDKLDAAYALCERALQLDARNVRALINLSFTFIDPALELQSTDRAADISRAEELVSRALGIDPNAYMAHFAKAELLMTQRRFDEAIVEAERCLALNPSFVNAYDGLSTAYNLLGQPERAVEYADRALRLSPRDPLLYVLYFEKGFALSLLQQDDEAIDWLRRSIAIAAGWPLPQVLLASELALKGQDAEAHQTIALYLSLSGIQARTVAQWKAQLPSDNPVFLAYYERLLDGLRKAGLPEQ